MEKKYTIGCKYDININPEEYDSPSLHGRVYVSGGRWRIESAEVKGIHHNNNNYNTNNNIISSIGCRRLWTKLGKDYKYLLKTNKKYKIRLGSLYHLSLQFYNY